jgi:hypothetical protein
MRSAQGDNAMSEQTVTALVAGVLCCLLLAGSVLASSSTNYWLDWFTPLTSGGGGAANSTNYAINLTIGQSAIGRSSSANYGVGLGYWHGVERQFKVYLPIVVK